jgi:hypothetical protein
LYGWARTTRDPSGAFVRITWCADGETSQPVEYETFCLNNIRMPRPRGRQDMPMRAVEDVACIHALNLRMSASICSLLENPIRSVKLGTQKEPWKDRLPMRSWSRLRHDFRATYAVVRTRDATFCCRALSTRHACRRVSARWKASLI